ncbi:MAG: Gfo/Idh/MocA family oxidoreductase [Verrucomicrobiales bacterium]|jgi:predicted dehydrogenase|nr:Gfo/Idh/MocA family oxidoreductase [Verrucomicrobiales bacterium]
MQTPYIPSRRYFVRSALALGAFAPSVSLLRAEEKIWTVGVIGHTGRGDYGHGLDTVWLGLPETKIVGLADPVEAGREKAIARLKLKKETAFPDYRKMLDTIHPDLVAVCPRHVDQHHDMILAAVEAGVKGIYVEKPFCRNLIEADAIVAACEAHGTRLAIAHRNRYHPVLPIITKLIEDGAIGRWLEIRARGKEDARGGSLDLWVLGSHLLNLCHYFVGDPLTCSATILQDGRPVIASDVKEGAEAIGPLAGNEIHARFETNKGIPVFFDSVVNGGRKEAGFGIQLIGTEGIIDLRGDAEPLAWYLPGSPFQPGSEAKKWVPITTAGINQSEPIPDIRTLVGGHVAPARDLIAAIVENRETLCSERSGRTILEMIFSVFESHCQEGRRVEIPLQDRSHPLSRL